MKICRLKSSVEEKTTKQSRIQTRRYEHVVMQVFISQCIFTNSIRNCNEDLCRPYKRDILIHWFLVKMSNLALMIACINNFMTSLDSMEDIEMILSIISQDILVIIVHCC